MDPLRSGAEFIRLARIAGAITLLSCALLVGAGGYLWFSGSTPPSARVAATPTAAGVSKPESPFWRAPDSTDIPEGKNGDLIRYGRDLIVHTARYLGPQGSVLRISNGMNCQSCHLKAGTKTFGNNFAAVASGYPRYRARSGSFETIEKRVNDCLERSLNGSTLDSSSREMRAFVAYFLWIGQDVRPGTKPEGIGSPKLSLLDRPASPVKGRQVYEKYCLTCHGERAQGYKHPDSVEWHYPPLAGPASYNTAAGLYRLSQFASFVKGNMPYGTTRDNPVLSDGEAWDVAAYINSLPRPERRFAQDWPDPGDKPFDHPFGPFGDTFSETQHKYGPYGDIIAAHEKTATTSALNK